MWTSEHRYSRAVEFAQYNENLPVYIVTEHIVAWYPLAGGSGTSILLDSGVNIDVQESYDTVTAAWANQKAD